MQANGVAVKLAAIAINDIHHRLDRMEQLLIALVREGSKYLVATHIAMLATRPLLEVERLLLEGCHVLLLDMSLEEDALGQSWQKEVFLTSSVVEEMV